jgi:hypothetical protein
LAAYGREYRRTWRRRVVSILMLVPVLWLSVMLLRVPAGTALTVPALLIDRVVVVSTAVVLPVSVLLLLILPLRGARAAAIVGGVVSGIVGLPTVLAAVDTPRRLLPAALAVASVICGLALMATLLSTSLRGRRWSLSFLAPLSLLPLIQFWQATSYTPSQLVTSLTPAVHVSVQRIDAEERQGVIEVALENRGDVRVSLFTTSLIYCFVTEDDWDIRTLPTPDLLANENCTHERVVRRFAWVAPDTTETYSIPWRASADKSLGMVRVISSYVREDRVRLSGTPSEQDSGEGCQGPVTTYRLQPDTRFKGLVQPTRLLTFDEDGWQFAYAGAPLCEAESSSKLATELGTVTADIRRHDWLPDDS